MVELSHIPGSGICLASLRLVDLNLNKFKEVSVSNLRLASLRLVDLNL